MRAEEHERLRFSETLTQGRDPRLRAMMSLRADFFGDLQRDEPLYAVHKAALVVLTAAALDSPLWGFAYILLFGLGSIVGMAALSALIALPLTYTARSLTRANRALQLIVGIATIAIGLSVIEQSGSLLFA